MANFNLNKGDRGSHNPVPPFLYYNLLNFLKLSYIQLTPCNKQEINLMETICLFIEQFYRFDSSGSGHLINPRIHKRDSSESAESSKEELIYIQHGDKSR